MMTPSEILTIVFGGKSVFTLRSTQSGQEYTYMVEEADKRNPDDPEEIPVYFVKLLTGPGNLRDYTYVGTIFDRKHFRLTKKSRVTMQTPSVIAFDWSFRSILSGKVPATLEFLPSSRCARCGRVLTVSDSVLTGFGPECAGKVGVVYAHVRGTVIATKQDAPTQSTLLNNFKERLATKRVPATPTEIVEGIDKLLAPEIDDTKRFERLRKFRDANDDAGDAKFLALSEEAGITVEDWAWFSEKEHLNSARAAYKANDTKSVDASIEAAIAAFKAYSPDAYYQNGILSEQEAHAVAFMKFQHELSLR